MALEIDFEAAARKFCAMSGIAPDTMVNYVGPDGHTNPMQRPAWRNVEEALRIHHNRQTVLNTSWVMKQEAGAPAPVVAVIEEGMELYV